MHINRIRKDKMKRHIKVLLAEDEEQIRKLLHNVFTREGYTVFIAENGEDALNIAEREFPTIVITDYNMPKMDGLQLCACLRANPLTKRIPILITTGRPGEISETQAHIDLELSAVLAKPFNLRNLLLKVQEVLNSRYTPTNA